MCTGMCECEHSDHFIESDTDEGYEKWKKAKFPHTYGDTFDNISVVETNYGKFAICINCREAGHCPPKE